MTLVDVDRQTEGSDDLVARRIDDHIANTFDPVNTPVRPRAAMVESKRLPALDSRLHGALNQRSVAFVEMPDPIVERSTERRTLDTEEHCCVRVPRHRTSEAIPRPFAHASGGESSFQAVRREKDRVRFGQLSSSSTAGRCYPHRQRATKHGRGDGRQVTFAAGNPVWPPQYDGVRGRDRGDRKGASVSSSGRDERRKHQEGNQHPFVGAEIEDRDQGTGAQPRRNI